MVPFLIIVLVAAAVAIGFVVGLRRGNALDSADQTWSPSNASPNITLAADDFEVRVGAEKARIIRSRDSEAAILRQRVTNAETLRHEDAELYREREHLYAQLADARADSARYRALVIDIENNAPPPILAGIGEPDDLKLLVGIGPVLERMLHSMGVATFRQIARWSAKDIEDFDSRLSEFPGRIQRDQWVIQARALHESKYGSPPAP